MQAHEGSPWLDYREAAAYARVSVPTIKRWVNERKLPFSKLGDRRNCRVVIKREDLDAFIAGHRVGAL